MENETVWGDEIVVNGKRPEWLADHQEIMMFDGDWYGGTATKTPFYGRDVTHEEFSIRLPADHPHYASLATPPNTPAGYSDEVVERMADLVRSVATGKMRPGIDDWFKEARAIVALIEPVDVDLVEARKLNDDSPYDLTGLSAEHAARNVRYIEATILAAIARGRALAAEGK